MRSQFKNTPAEKWIDKSVNEQKQVDDNLEDIVRRGIDLYSKPDAYLNVVKTLLKREDLDLKADLFADEFFDQQTATIWLAVLWEAKIKHKVEKIALISILRHAGTHPLKEDFNPDW